MTNKALTGATYDSDGGQQINSPSRVTDAHPASRKEDIMEFLVEFEVNVPDGTPASEVQHRENAEATAAAKLVDEGHLPGSGSYAPHQAAAKSWVSTAPTARLSSAIYSGLCRSTSGCI
jgi:predicted dienelactone hydrolase